MTRCFGLDAHKEVVQICCLDAAGTEVFNRRIGCSREVLLQFARQHLTADDQLAIEATTNTWAIVDGKGPTIAGPFAEFA